MKNIVAVIILTAFSLCTQAEKFEGLALTPPMGWNSWNTFACNINEKIIKETADIMVKSGMRDAGYVHLNIDDCWHGERDQDGFIQPDLKRFPSGMKALSDYIHEKGLKFGLYSDAGDKTCGGKPGSNGYEYQDALQYSRWGVDYLKYDWCNTEQLSAPGAYRTMRDALHKAGNPVVLSICEWGDNEPWLWGKDIGHLWRTTGDIINCWDCEVDHGSWSSWGIMRIVDMQKGLRQYAGPGHWNDPDMMEVGNGMSTAEDRAHFSLWAMLSAPLIAGNDLKSMSKETIDIMTNKAVIEINQDKLGIQAFKYKVEGDIEYWFKPLDNKSWGFLILNRGKKVAQVSFDFRNEEVVDPHFPKKGAKYKTNFFSSRYSIKNIWLNTGAGTTQKILKAKIEPHGVVMYRLDRLTQEDNPTHSQ